MEILLYSVVSWISILITLALYIVLWRKHNFHGWTQFAFLVSALFYFVIVFLRKLYRNLNGPTNSSPTIERLFTFLTLAHCTNVVNLSFHIFMTFLKTEPEIPIRKIGDLSPLFKSLVVCWTFPAFITIIELFVNDGTGKLLEQGVLVALLSLNFVIIMIIVILIARLIRESRKVQSTTSNSFELRPMIFLFVRLFCITGLIWTVKSVPLLVIQSESDRTSGFWKAMNFLSDSYGVVIFLVFVYNTRILIALRDFPVLRKVLLFGCNCFESKESKSLVVPERVSFRKARMDSSAACTFLLRSS